MKKNKNFLMWTVLFALFTVTLHSVADAAAKNAYYAPVPSLFWSGGWDSDWSNKDSVIIVETTPPNFVDTIKEYTAVVPYDAKYLRLHVKWDSVGNRSNGADTLPAIVKNGNEQIWADMDKSSASSWYDSVYVVQFKSKTDYDINGTFGFDLPSALGGGTKSYSLKISRAQASTVSTLKYLTVARTKVATPTAESWKTAFEHVADDKSRDSVLLDKFDATSPVLSGKYVANAVSMRAIRLLSVWRKQVR